MPSSWLRASWRPPVGRCADDAFRYWWRTERAPIELKLSRHAFRIVPESCDDAGQQFNLYPDHPAGR